MISFRSIFAGMALLAVAFTGSMSIGQVTDSKPVTQNPPRTEADFIHRQMLGGESEFREALARIKVLTDAGVQVSSKWLTVLFEKGYYEDVESIALKGILNSAEITRATSDFQKFRVRAFLERGKLDEALIAVKAYYNVAPLKDTEGAVKLASSCLSAKHPDDLLLIKRFKSQQVEWSTATTAPASSPELGENILKSIRVPADPFAGAAAAVTRRDFMSLIAKGNLLLLADKAADARRVFEAAELVAERPDQVSGATEGIARAIRAEAAALGPANAFIVSRQNGH